MNISPPGENGNLSYHTSFYYLFTWVRTIPWGRARQPTPVSLPGESHGQRSLVGYSPWSHKELDTTEQLTLSHFRDGQRGLQRLSSQPKVVKAVSPILRSVLFCECVLGRRGDKHNINDW